MNLDSMQEIVTAARREGKRFWEIILETDMENRGLRLMQGTSTRPATGSQARPIRFFSAMATACPRIGGDFFFSALFYLDLDSVIRSFIISGGCFFLCVRICHMQLPPNEEV